MFFSYQYNLYQYNRYFSAYEAEKQGLPHEFSDKKAIYGSRFEAELLDFSDYYYSNIERTVIGMFGLYFLNVIDAMIDAHFFYFDISDDLSFHWQPDLKLNPYGFTASGISLSLNF